MNNLTLGSTGQSVIELQKYLKNNGLYSGTIDGIYGPKTQAAVKTFQSLHSPLKVDGIVGPKTKSVIAGVGNFIAPNTSGTAKNIDPTQKQIYDQFFNESDDEISQYYKQMQNKDSADVQDSLAQSQADYDKYLEDSAAQFGQDKDTQDTTSAQQGVLFSTGRVQKLNNLQSSYASDLNYKKDKLGRSMGMAARDFQYKYGKAPTQSLSSYLKLGGQSYDAFTPRGKVTAGGLSSVYNPNSYNYDGTIQGERYTEAQRRAALKYQNYNNKQMLNSYSYQL